MKKKLYQKIQSLLSPLKTSFFIQLSLFLFVLFFLIFPSILNRQEFTLPTKPKTLFDALFFFSGVLIFAMFEELIYRVYIPFQLKSLYNFFVKLKINSVETIIFSRISNIFFALAHSYLGIYNVVFALIMGGFFSLIYETIKLKKQWSCAFLIISFLHFCYNTIVLIILMYGKF